MDTKQIGEICQLFDESFEQSMDFVLLLRPKGGSEAAIAGNVGQGELVNMLTEALTVVHAKKLKPDAEFMVSEDGEVATIQ